MALGFGLMVFYFLCSLTIDNTAHLLTDVGGKVASIEAMSTRGDWNPNIGYWFEDSDPDGRFFPFEAARLTVNDQWIDTTSLTLIFLARPLWDLGGPEAAVLIPMFGSVLAALGGGALERKFNPARSGVISTLVVGLGTPAVVYALDIWEHSLGLASGIWGAVFVLDAIEKRTLKPAVLSGMVFGFGMTMRQELYVYGFAAGLCLVWWLFRSDGVSRALKSGAAMFVGMLSVMGSYTILEIVVLGTPARLDRAKYVGAEHRFDVLEQIEASFIIALGPIFAAGPVPILIGLAACGSLAWLTHLQMEGANSEKAVGVCLAVWGCIVLMFFVRGPNVVPGAFIVAPLAVVGLTVAIKQRRWLLLALGGIPLVLVSAKALTGGPHFQWGGRYLLITGAFFSVAAIAFIQSKQPKFIAAVATVGIAFGLFGVVFFQSRASRVAESFTELQAVTSDDEVIVWQEKLVAREAGEMVVGSRWLAAEYPEDRVSVAELLQASEIQTFVWIDENDSEFEDFPGYEPGDKLGNLSLWPMRLTRYERVSG